MTYFTINSYIVTYFDKYIVYYQQRSLSVKSLWSTRQNEHTTGQTHFFCSNWTYKHMSLSRNLYTQRRISISSTRHCDKKIMK